MVIESIIKGPRAWTSAAKLVLRWGAAAVHEAAAAGLIECWDHDRAGKRLRAPAWTLTVHGARLYGVKIAEIPDSLGMGVPFWSCGEDEAGRPRRCRGLAAPRHAPEPRPVPPAKGGPVLGPDGVPLVVLGVQAAADPRLGRRGCRCRRGRRGSNTSRRLAAI